VRRARLTCALLAAALALAAANPAVVAAYADMLSADPAPGSTVVGSPAAIRVEFSQPLLPASHIDLYTAQFVAVPGVSTLVAGSELRGVLSQPLAPATYTVQWSAVSDDGQATRGSFQFAVAPARSLFGGLSVWVVVAALIVVGVVALFARGIQASGRIMDK